MFSQLAMELMKISGIIFGRNSWSAAFGENEYIRLNRNTTCGTD